MLLAHIARAIALSVLFTLALPRAALAAQPRGGAPPAANAAPEAESDAPPPGDTAPETQMPWKPGPAKIDLGHDLDLDLPDAYVFLGMPEAGKLLEKLGNFHNEDLLGLITAKEGDSDWFVTVRYDDPGFIKDDEKIDADELLDAIREGTEEANKEREERGFKALHVDGWAEPPRYEKGAHHLVWALLAKSDNGTSVNFNTRILGRHGYVALNLVTEPAALPAHKPHAATLLAATHYRKGARYEDFNQKSDKVAEYGLIGLVLGGAGLAATKLVKIGLLAKFGKVILAALIAGKKAIIAGLLGLGALAKRLFTKKQPEGPSQE